MKVGKKSVLFGIRSLINSFQVDGVEVPMDLVKALEDLKDDKMSLEDGVKIVEAVLEEYECECKCLNCGHQMPEVKICLFCGSKIGEKLEEKNLLQEETKMENEPKAVNKEDMKVKKVYKPFKPDTKARVVLDSIKAGKTLADIVAVLKAKFSDAEEKALTSSARTLISDWQTEKYGYGWTIKKDENGVIKLEDKVE